MKGFLAWGSREGGKQTRLKVWMPRVLDERQLSPFVPHQTWSFLPTLAQITVLAIYLDAQAKNRGRHLNNSLEHPVFKLMSKSWWFSLQNTLRTELSYFSPPPLLPP